MWTIFWMIVLVIMGLVVWLIIILNKEDDNKEERVFAINFADLDAGRAYGNIISIDKRPHGRHLVTLEPRDIGLKTIKDKKKIPNEEFIVATNKISTLPKGRWSKDKNILVLLPQHARDFPEEFLETSIGKALAFYVEYLNSDNTVKDAMAGGIEIMKSHLQKIGEGEMSIELINQLQGLFKDVATMKDDVRKDKSASFIPPSQANLP